MRFWIGTAVVFLGPLLAGLTLRPLPSVIVYAGIMVFWFLKIRPVAAPSPSRLAFLVLLLTVLAALIHTVGTLVAAMFGILWQLPFWLPAVVSVLGVVIARPLPGQEGAAPPGGPDSGAGGLGGAGGRSGGWGGDAGSGGAGGGGE